MAEAGDLGQAALRLGLVTAEQLDDCRRECKDGGPSLGEVLLKRGHLAAEQLQLLLGLQSQSLEDLRILGGRYRIQSTIGRGGQASVFVAEDMVLRRDVAIKVYYDCASWTAQHRDRFTREIRTLAAMNAPDVVAIHDACIAPNQAYYVMELLQGMTFAEHLRASGTMLRWALDILQRACTALGRLHARGVVHRDVKPSNLFVTDENRVVLIDFGLARGAQGEALTTERIVQGTISYMAPEQIRAETDVDHRADIFACGVVLYEILTGRVPFHKSTTDFEYAQRALAEEPETPRTLNSAVPADLEAVCLRAMHKDRQVRYWSAADLAADLDRCVLRLPPDTRVLASPSGDTAALSPSRTPSGAPVAVIDLLGQIPENELIPVMREIIGKQMACLGRDRLLALLSQIVGVDYSGRIDYAAIRDPRGALYSLLVGLQRINPLSRLHTYGILRRYAAGAAAPGGEPCSV